ncbi:MAG TPA: hypothetical protein VFO89_09465 [Thermoanaerobaculia bacterium]|nr:hypothetical protein [Thermoanaerobaculia bacterium]
MTTAASLPSHRSLAHRPPHLFLFLPLFATGCSNTDVLLTIASLTFAGGVLLLFAGFVIGVELCCRTYGHWESVLGEEHRRDLLRLTDASTDIAREAEAAITACRAALRDLQRTATNIRR